MNELVTIDLNTNNVIKSKLLEPHYCTVGNKYNNELNHAQVKLYYNNVHERDRLIQKIIQDNAYELYDISIKLGEQGLSYCKFKICKNDQTTELLNQLNRRIANTCLYTKIDIIRVDKTFYDSDYILRDTNKFAEVMNENNDINFIVTLIEEF